MTNLQQLFQQTAVRHKELKELCQPHSPHALAKEFHTDRRTILVIENTGEIPKRCKLNPAHVAEITRRLKIYRKNEPELYRTSTQTMARKYGIKKQTAYQWASGMGKSEMGVQESREALCARLANRFVTMATTVSRPANTTYY